MSLPKPRPSIDYDITPFWEGVREHRFLLLRCTICGTWYWPAAYCRMHSTAEPFAGNMQWEEASGRGRVFVFNVHHWAFDPAFADDIPYVYALIELAEGPMFGTNILADPSEVTIGAPVEIVFEKDRDSDVILPKARLLKE